MVEEEVPEDLLALTRRAMETAGRLRPANSGDMVTVPVELGETPSEAVTQILSGLASATGWTVAYTAGASVFTITRTVRFNDETGLTDRDGVLIEHTKPGTPTAYPQPVGADLTLRWNIRVTHDFALIEKDLAGVMRNEPDWGKRAFWAMIVLAILQGALEVAIHHAGSDGLVGCPRNRGGAVPGFRA